MLGALHLPSDEVLLNDPATSRWLKDAIATSRDRDPVDAYKDAYSLLLIAGRRCRDAGAV